MNQSVFVKIALSIRAVFTHWAHVRHGPLSVGLDVDIEVAQLARLKIAQRALKMRFRLVDTAVPAHDCLVGSGVSTTIDFTHVRYLLGATAAVECQPRTSFSHMPVTKVFNEECT